MPSTAPEWYAIAQAGICLSAGWAVIAMYWRGTPVRRGEEAGASAESKTPERDPGLLWLGLAVLVWGLVGLELLLPWDGATAQSLRPLLSSANSACLLISASHLDYGVELLQRARTFKRWKQAAIAGSLAVAALTLALYALLGREARVAQLPDFLLSQVTLLLYGFGLFRSFYKRGFRSLALFSLVAVAFSSFAQLPEITDSLASFGLAGERRWMLNLVSKSMTIVAFLSLGMSWVHEVARRPSQRLVRLRFTGRHPEGPQGRRRYVVQVAEVDVEIRETPHRDLLFLAVRRAMEANKPDGGWVSLVDLVNKLDDSRIRRLRDELRPVGLDTAVESNFQKSYRLAVDPDHVAFDRAALAEDPALVEIVRWLG